MHALEAEVMHEIGDARRHDDRLLRGDRGERAAVQVIEVGVRNEHEVDVRQVVDGQPGALEPPDDDEPVGPVRVDEDVVPRRLDEERRMADPGQADLAALELGENRPVLHAAALDEERRDENLGDEVALVPARGSFLFLLRLGGGDMRLGHGIVRGRRNQLGSRCGK
jgi:hypothetical protein